MTAPTTTRPKAGRAQPSGLVPPRKPLITLKRREALAAWGFVLPALLGFLAFFVWPALSGLYYSFTDFDLLTAPEFIGLDNYTRLAADPLFWNAIGTTSYYVAINIGLQTVLALGIAVLMHRLTQSMVIRGIVMLPYLIANVIAALVWFYMFDFQFGIVNEVINAIGLDRVAFFGESDWAIPTVALINVWRHMGYTALLIFAGLQTIPKEVYEAGAIDGGSELRMFRSITLPLLRPVLAMVLVVTVTGSFQLFDTIAVTTQGGPVNSTRVINYYIFDMAFNRFDFGYGSAMALALFVLLAAFTFIQLRLTRANKSDLG
ncbi:multiple sugar transport system permease protein [Conyzicola lurida]|uniref:Multiple sugar transport system permease protein n=1 Tax=Conyzicola lurida TaxID=1172621 RepID=A0A841AR89_9MICO|nr:sugar ABC transporter permease [Conyzicola lurida]MBB5844085.1 multiple sugar transport system permease protein [Conyzicola lurida]